VGPLDVVALVDAYDVLLCPAANQIAQRFRALGKPVVFLAEQAINASLIVIFLLR
jgi:hypothetical protein